MYQRTTSATPTFSQPYGRSTTASRRHQRIVPVKLIAGKEYVLRNGRHVTVQENPHWQCRVNYPFAVIQGPDFVVYYDEEGNTGSGTAHEHDIMRPVYKEGEVYLDRVGIRQVIDLDDSDPTYPLENEERDESWTRDGRVIHLAMSERLGDLMDYEHRHGLVFSPVPPPAPVDPWIGKRVKFNHHGINGYGKVVAKAEDDLDYAVEVEDAGPGCHQCCGLVPSGHGWFVPPFAMSEAPFVDDLSTQATVVDGVPAMPELAPIEALPSLVGVRVELTIYDILYRGVVKFEDGDGFFAVELDADVQYPWMHDCGGRCKDGRGWWAPRDSLREVDETPVETESSESLTEADVVEVWAAYRINPSIDIYSWIAARLKLKAAVK